MPRRPIHPTIPLTERDETLLSPRQVGAYLGLTRRDVVRLMEAGTFGGIVNVAADQSRLERRIRYGDLRDWIVAQRGKTNGE